MRKTADFGNPYRDNPGNNFFEILSSKSFIPVPQKLGEQENPTPCSDAPVSARFPSNYCLVICLLLKKQLQVQLKAEFSASL